MLTAASVVILSATLAQTTSASEIRQWTAWNVRRLFQYLDLPAVGKERGQSWMYPCCGWGRSAAVRGCRASALWDLDPTEPSGTSGAQEGGSAWSHSRFPQELSDPVHAKRMSHRKSWVTKSSDHRSCSSHSLFPPQQVLTLCDALGTDRAHPQHIKPFFPAKQPLSLEGKHDIGGNFFPISATNSLCEHDQDQATFSPDASIFPLFRALKHTGQANGLEKENALMCK